jgi:hypothetical protein
MPINPNIALSGKGIELANPLEQYGRMVSIQQAQQGNALRQAQIDEYQRAQEQQNALRSTLFGFTPGMSTADQVSALQRGGFLAEASQLAKTSAETTADELKSEGVRIENERKKLELLGQVYGSVANNPTVDTAGSALQYLLNNRFVDPNNAAQVWQQIQANPTPDNIRSMAQQFQMMSVSAKDQLDAALRARAIAVQEGQLAAKPSTPLSADAGKTAAPVAGTPLLSQAILDGRVPVARVNSRTAPIFEAALSIDPNADLTSLNIEQTGAGAGARTAGTAKANISIASDEANRMIGVLQEIIPTVNLAEYPSINAITNAISKGTGGVEIVKLNTAINSLINSYARAINPRGQPTVSDKSHARDMINNAMSKGQLAGALEVMRQEMEAALGAATTATNTRGKAGEQPKSGTRKTASGVSYTVED